MDDTLVFYKPTTGTGDVYGVTLDCVNDIANFNPLHPAYSGWRATWAQIVFCGTTLLFYDPSAGNGEIYSDDGYGNLNLLKSYSGWRSTWKQILQIGLPGVDEGTANHILFYDPSAGEGEIYSVDSSGNLSLLKSYSGWRSTWGHIVSWAGELDIYVQITTNCALLFYDRAVGSGEIYSVDGHGNIGLIQSYSGWRTTWTHLVALENAALVFYDQSAGYGEMYAIDSKTNNISFLKSYSDWGSSWTHLVPLHCSSGLALLFYDEISGRAVVYAVDILTGELNLLGTPITSWQANWASLVSTASSYSGVVKLHVV